MNKKKEQTEENKDRLQILERRYAKWKEKQRLEELLEMEEYISDEPDYLDLNIDKRWQA